MSHPGHTGRPAAAGGEAIDVREHGLSRDGERQTSDARLFLQLLVFDVSGGAAVGATLAALTRALEAERLPCVVYEDLHAPRGLALLTWAEDPLHFVDRVRPLFEASPLAPLTPRPGYTMFGRTYGSGFEPDLRYWLLERPREQVLKEDHRWAVWYPLRRTGAFARLAADEQRAILAEHGQLGRAYGAQDLAHDVRLVCHGLDAGDNEFVIGLLGRELHPLSHLVQAMRRTRQTSEYIEKMGPFFVGRARFRRG